MGSLLLFFPSLSLLFLSHYTILSKRSPYTNKRESLYGLWVTTTNCIIGFVSPLFVSFSYSRSNFLNKGLGSIRGYFGLNISGKLNAFV